MADFADGDFATLLKSFATITAIVGSGATARIRPGRLMQGDALPAIRYAFPAIGSVQHLGGISGTATPTLQVDAYAETEAAAWQLSEKVRLALCLFRGAVPGGTVFVEGFLLTNRIYRYEDPVDASDKGKHRFIMLFDVAHSEATS
jgi:hypothetical protein